MKAKKLKNGILIVGLSADTGRAQVQLRGSVRDATIVPDKSLVENLAARIGKDQVAKLWGMPIENSGGTTNKNDNFTYDGIVQVLPVEGEFVTVKFRALSKAVIPGHWLDFSIGNVLEDSTQLLNGVPVYPDHDYSSIDRWLGAVSAVEWDAADVAGKGAPGINATYKIDALMNPRVARGLLMKPPAIRSTSMTVLFDFEPSHPEIWNEERWKFLDLLGEEVNGELVRLKVTEIHEYWEAGLVFLGADPMARKIDGEDEVPPGEEDYQSFSATAGRAAAEPPILNEEKTMKLTSEQKKKLGIEVDGDEVPETVLLAAGESLADKFATLSAGLPDNVEELKAQAAAGTALVEKLRAKVLADAKIAELGAETGELAAVIADDIKAASVERLNQLETYYGEKIAAKFPNGGKSSEEDHEAVEQAGVVKAAAKKLPKVSVH